MDPKKTSRALQLRVKFIAVFVVIALVPLLLLAGLFAARFHEIPLRYIVAVCITVLLFAAGVARLFADSVVKPIEKILEASRQIAAGHFEYQVTVATKDEIEDLAQGFNAMARTLRATFLDLQQGQSIMAAERNKLAVVLSGITDGVIAVDRDRNIIIFNKAAEEITGALPERVLGGPIDSVIRILDNENEIPAHEYCAIQGSGTEGISFIKKGLKMIGLDGKEHYVNLTSGQIKEGRNINLGCILTFHDVTRETLIEKLKTEFVSIAAHQLRTPLSAIKWSLKMLLDGDMGVLSHDQKDLVEKSFRSNERMIFLINDLLNVTRIEEGKYVHEQKLADIVEILTETAETAKDEAAQKGFTLEFTIPKEKPPLILIDIEGMRLVLQNLTENAIRYTPPGGTVTISLAHTDKDIVVSVHDTGVGIPQEDQSRIFTKFFRGDNVVRMETEGTGLGLFIAKNIVEAHGGKIWFDSAPGKGSTFSFSLPIPRE